MIELALQHILETDSSVTTLVGTRIDWGARSQGDDVPCLVHAARSVEPFTMAGETGLQSATVELHGLAEDAQTAAAIAFAARDAIVGTSTHSLVGSTGVRFESAWTRSYASEVPIAVNGEERGICDYTVVLTVGFTE